MRFAARLSLPVLLALAGGLLGCGSTSLPGDDAGATADLSSPGIGDQGAGPGDLPGPVDGGPSIEDFALPGDDAAGREERDALEAEGRSRAVAAESLEAFAIAGVDENTRVDVEGETSPSARARLRPWFAPAGLTSGSKPRTSAVHGLFLPRCGALQNRLLERGLVARLGAETVVMARDVPVNDGGLALGQAWAAVLALTEPASAAVDRAAGLAREDEPA